MEPSKAKRLNVELWVAQAVLAVVFLFSGLVRAFAPLAQLRVMYPWTDEVNVHLERWLGYALILVAIGLVLPRPIKHLVPGTAIVVGLIMVVLSATNALHGQASRLLLSAVLLALSVFVAWGRAVRVPFEPRGDEPPLFPVR